MKNIIRYCGLLLVGLVSCMEDEAPSVELNVALDKQVYQVGEPVTFKLNGNPDNIVFYSGEVGIIMLIKKDIMRMVTCWSNSILGCVMEIFIII